jgi:hypothetical protein
MDRRQLLAGMTAVGVAGQLNLNELLSAQVIETNSEACQGKRKKGTLSIMCPFFVGRVVFISTAG